MENEKDVILSAGGGACRYNLPLTNQEQRNYGIDALKTISMLMVVVLHLFGHGGVLDALVKDSLGYYIAWGVEVLCYSAVNVFALTTGYLMAKRKWKLSNILSLWLQVFFYSVIISLIVAIINPEVIGIKFIIKTLMPVCMGSWWYFTAYFGLFLLMPFVNKMMDSLSKRQTAILVGILIVLFVVIETLSPVAPFKLNGGYSMLWLVVLYIIGAGIKRYNFGIKLKKRWLTLIFLLCAILASASKIVIRLITNKVLGYEAYDNILISYTSPLVVIMAVCMFLFFIKINFCEIFQKMLKFLSPLAFGVYLISEHPYLRQLIIENKFASLAEKNAFLMVGIVLLSALVIFVGSIIVEWLRRLLFKVVGIDKGIRRLGNKLDEKINFNKNEE